MSTRTNGPLGGWNTSSRPGLGATLRSAGVDLFAVLGRAATLLGRHWPVLLAILVANFVVNEGESTWFEGLQLLALYALLGVVFFYA